MARENLDESEMMNMNEQKSPRTPPGPPDFVEGPQLPTPEQLADWQRFQQQPAEAQSVQRANDASWEAEETPDQIKQLQGQGVLYVRWITHPGDKSDSGENTGKASTPVCPDCVYNDQIVMPLGEAFPSGNLLPPAHPHCRCTYEPATGPQSAEEAETAVEKTDLSLDY